MTTLLLLALAAADRPPVVGFSEPLRTVAVSAAEPGVLRTVDVVKGQRVAAGGLLATLDDDVLRAARDLAEATAEGTAALEAARIRLERAEQTRRRLRVLETEGHGGREEIARAEADVRLARTDVAAAEEDRRLASLQVAKIDAELRRRRIAAPFAGTVADVAREPGEYVAGGEASAVVTLVDLSKLRVRFHVPTARAAGLEQGDAVAVRLVHDGRRVPAAVEFASPVIDAESDTVRVDVLIDNAAGGLRSGRRCQLLLDGADRLAGGGGTGR